MRIGTPWRRSATPSAFQKPVAASTLPAAREATALKPIVTRLDLGRVAAVGADLGVDHGFVGGQAGDADRVALEVAGAATGPSPRAITAASGRCTIGITPTRSRPRSRAIPRSWMSRIAKSARPAASSFGASVDSPGCRISRSTPASS